VALGFPGPFDYAAGICLIEDGEKYAAIYRVNMRDALRTRLNLGDLPILFRNDAEAAVVGEARYGAGLDYRRLIGVTLGTGCGSAFLLNGMPVTSGPGVPPNGWLYPMLFHGLRADDVFSRRGLEARLQSAGVRERDVKAAATAARAGDIGARQVFNTFGADLGSFLNSHVVAFAAEAVLVLGRIAGAFDLFGPFLRQTLSVPALPGERGSEAALLGAADLMFFHSPEGRVP
jgi:glucokinase